MGRIDLEPPANGRPLEVSGHDAAPWQPGDGRGDEPEGWDLRTDPDVVEA